MKVQRRVGSESGAEGIQQAQENARQINEPRPKAGLEQNSMKIKASLISIIQKSN